MIKVVVCGASGRMGQTIGRMVNESSDLELVGGINLKARFLFRGRYCWTQDAEALLKKKKPDVLIDFTIAQAAVENVKMAARNNVALVVGTTGFTPEQRKEMEQPSMACARSHLKQLLGRGQYLLAARAGSRKAPQGL